MYIVELMKHGRLDVEREEGVKGVNGHLDRNLCVDS